MLATVLRHDGPSWNPSSAPRVSFPGLGTMASLVGIGAKTKGRVRRGRRNPVFEAVPVCPARGLAGHFASLPFQLLPPLPYFLSCPSRDRNTKGPLPMLLVALHTWVSNPSTPCAWRPLCRPWKTSSAQQRDGLPNTRTSRCLALSRSLPSGNEEPLRPGRNFRLLRS